MGMIGTFVREDTRCSLDYVSIIVLFSDDDAVEASSLVPVR